MAYDYGSDGGRDSPVQLPVRPDSALELLRDSRASQPPDRSTTPLSLPGAGTPRRDHLHVVTQRGNERHGSLGGESASTVTSRFAHTTGDYSRLDTSGDFEAYDSDDERRRAAAITPKRYERMRRAQLRKERQKQEAGGDAVDGGSSPGSPKRKSKSPSSRRRRKGSSKRRSSRRSARRTSGGSRSSSRGASRKPPSPTAALDLPKLPQVGSHPVEGAQGGVGHVLRSPLLANAPKSAREVRVQCAQVVQLDCASHQMVPRHRACRQLHQAHHTRTSTGLTPLRTWYVRAACVSPPGKPLPTPRSGDTSFHAGGDDITAGTYPPRFWSRTTAMVRPACGSKVALAHVLSPLCRLRLQRRLRLRLQPCRPPPPRTTAAAVGTWAWHTLDRNPRRSSCRPRLGRMRQPAASCPSPSCRRAVASPGRIRSLCHL